MKKEIKVIENYNGHNINYIDFAKWYTVFTHKDDGTTAMHHFETPEQTKDFIDEYEKNNIEKKFWWNKE